jgi:transposase-like protein
MDGCVGAAARLPESNRRDIAVLALARSATVTDLATRHGVAASLFTGRPTKPARGALDDAFRSAAPENEVLFELTVTKTWLRQMIVALTLMCRGSYRGVIEFMRDLLGVSGSLGTVHHALQSAARQADVINREQAGPIRYSRGPA